MTGMFRTEGFDALADDLHRMRVNTTQTRPVLKEIADILAGAQRRQFATRGSHYGSPWDVLDPDTIAEKGHSRVLEDTGRLRRSVAPASAEGFGVLDYRKNAVEVGTDLPYAAHVHYGDADTPGRPLVGELPESDQKTIAEAVHRHITKGTRHARS